MIQFQIHIINILLNISRKQFLSSSIRITEEDRILVSKRQLKTAIHFMLF